MADLSPIPYRVKMVDRNGLITRNWQQFFEALLRRAGGVGSVPDLGELEDSSAVDSQFSDFVGAELAQRSAEDLRELFSFEPDAEVASLRQALRELRRDVDIGISEPMVTPVQRAKDFQFEVARGNIPGLTGVNKFGESTNVDSGVDTDIWDRANATDDQKIWVAPTAARTHQIVSSSANDTSAGTGARTIRISGLTDWSTKEVSEDITMNGTTNVATSNSYVIIHRMEVLTKGSAGPNVGTITATADTDSTVTAQIQAGLGQTLMAIYGVPSVQTAYVQRLYGNLRGSAGAVGATVYLLENPEPDAELTGFLTKHVFGVQGEGTSALTIPFQPPKVTQGPAIIKVQAEGSANNMLLSAGFDLILEDN